MRYVPIAMLVVGTSVGTEGCDSAVPATYLRICRYKQFLALNARNSMMPMDLGDNTFTKEANNLYF